MIFRPDGSSAGEWDEKIRIQNPKMGNMDEIKFSLFITLLSLTVSIAVERLRIFTIEKD